jgi:hypothetical protein
MKIKDCRILWNEDVELKKIIDIEIHEFIIENGGFRNRFLHEKFSWDIGNASKTWGDWDLEKILIEFLCIRKFSSEEVKQKFINQLRKLDVFEENYQFLTRKYN